MSIRFGRLRAVDIALFASGAGFLHVLSSQVWFENSAGGAERGFAGLGSIGLLAAVCGVLAILVVPATVMRTSAASALALDVFISTLGLFAVIGLALTLVWPPDTAGSASDVTMAAFTGFGLMFLTWTFAVLSLRSESRGISPDPEADVEVLVLGSERLSRASAPE